MKILDFMDKLNLDIGYTDIVIFSKDDYCLYDSTREQNDWRFEESLRQDMNIFKNFDIMMFGIDDTIIRIMIDYDYEDYGEIVDFDFEEGYTKHH